MGDHGYQQADQDETSGHPYLLLTNALFVDRMD
jgi:hypothetical protein